MLRDVMREREVFKHMLCNKSSMSENVVFVKLWQKTASKPVNEGGEKFNECYVILKGE